MCGISGIFNFSNKKINNKEIIKKILDIQNQRGPDNRNLWVSECKKITLGHNRLSIIDLSKNSNQPFISEDDNYIITFNGEIYNFKDLRKELIKKNFFFKTNSDTEVILQSYKCWGLNFTKFLRGMFAFVIYDKVKKKIILARDPFGIKPLYYTNNNGVLYFASQIKALLSIKDISFTTSKAGICSYYMWGHVQEPFTLYNEIRSLEKGTIKIIDINGNENNLSYGSIKETILNSNFEKLFGKKIRQPIGGDFSFSPKLANYWLKQKWHKTTFLYGIDIFMTMHALMGNFKTEQTNLGAKIHKPSAPKLGPMFTQVLTTFFKFIKANRKKWDNPKLKNDIINFYNIYFKT